MIASHTSHSQSLLDLCLTSRMSTCLEIAFDMTNVRGVPPLPENLVGWVTLRKQERAFAQLKTQIDR
jgi:hypothetical protein